MTLNPKALIPPIEVLYSARAGIVNEMSGRRSPKAIRRLQAIYKEITFIIQSV